MLTGRNVGAALGMLAITTAVLLWATRDSAPSRLEECSTAAREASEAMEAERFPEQPTTLDDEEWRAYEKAVDQWEQRLAEIEAQREAKC